MSLLIYKKFPDATCPTRQLLLSVGYDVCCYLKTESGRPSSRVISSQMTIAFPTGIVAIPPPGHILLCCSRSGLAAKGIFVANAPGIVDPDYIGELIILLFNGGWEPQYIKHEDRIAQLLIIPTPAVPEVEERPIEELPKVEPPYRGERGFGSTGR